ncbi:E3 ubiquitin-protein ligase MARCHF11 [Protopterus annectens]|uniref:E3 ubiquitin-protein ligase MARCHF11 n=1 Tax=Protopterus annectens TaxID=7888 RepID=UPI001CFB6C5D|nr:E3 ubiquitin-protein ligase MARCHF11 [Protopterus annectens]
MSTEDEAGLGFKAVLALSPGSSSPTPPPPCESCTESVERLDLNLRRQQQEHAEGDMEQEELDAKACDDTSDAQEMILASAAAPGEKVCECSQSLSGSESESTCSTDPSPTPICRICFQGLEQGNMLNPCRCDGSVRYTHQPCLLKWISERGSWNCELCCYRYQVTAIKMKQPDQWQGITVTLVEKVQIIAVMLGSLFLIASITWLLWSAFSPNAVWQRKDILFQICYGMYGFMDLVCLEANVLKGQIVRCMRLHNDDVTLCEALTLLKHEFSERGYKMKEIEWQLDLA